MKEKIFYAALVAILLWMTTNVHVVEACMRDFIYNFWYVESYEIDLAALPDGIELEIYRKQGEDGVVPTLRISTTIENEIYVFDKLEEALEDETAQLLLSLERGGTIEPDTLHKLGSLITQNPDVHSRNQGLYRFLSPYDRLSDWNPQSVNRDERVIQTPVTTNILFASTTQLWRVPITTTYELSPFHDDKKLSDFGKETTDQAYAADYIAVGTIRDASPLIGVSERPSSVEIILDEPNIEGYALVEVEEWLFGEGPSFIHLGEFQFCCSCKSQGIVGQKSIFYISSLDQVTGLSEIVSVPGGQAFVPITDENKGVILKVISERTTQQGASPVGVTEYSVMGVILVLLVLILVGSRLQVVSSAKNL